MENNVYPNNSQNNYQPPSNNSSGRIPFILGIAGLIISLPVVVTAWTDISYMEIDQIIVRVLDKHFAMCVVTIISCILFLVGLYGILGNKRR